MAGQIRQATVADAPQWVALLKDVLGDDYPDRQVYDINWVLGQFGPGSEFETWVVDWKGRLGAAISFLPPRPDNPNPIANMGRHLVRPECYSDGSAGELLKKVNDLVTQRKQHFVTRVLASDHPQQLLYEKLGYVCTGFQPFKHMNRIREGTLFYVRLSRPDLAPRWPISESLPQIKELAGLVLSNCKIPEPPSVRDGTIGYPLQTDVQLKDVTFTEFEQARKQAGPKLSEELSGYFNLGHGLLRTAAPAPLRGLLAIRDKAVVGGLTFYFDPFDRCLRLTHSFSKNDLCMGALVRRALQIGQEQLSAVYGEMDVLVTAPRLLKTAEQLGFVPVAYFPEFFFRGGTCIDVIKLMKLNMIYSPDNSQFTPQARAVANVVDHNFQDQKVGVAIINLLRGLPIFDGLGDGELRKIARLFTQKLFQAGEKIFGKGDSGKEAYVIMRGGVDIMLYEETTPIATVGRGQIFGELAFLDGAARAAYAVANAPTILLIVQRSAFQDLVENEPHLGAVVMRNIAMELTRRLRKTTSAVSGVSR